MPIIKEHNNTHKAINRGDWQGALIIKNVKTSVFKVYKISQSNI